MFITKLPADIAARAMHNLSDVLEYIDVIDEPAADEIQHFSRQASSEDLHILAAAPEAGCGVLVTYNTADFYLAPETGILVMHPGQLLDAMRQ